MDRPAFRLECGLYVIGDRDVADERGPLDRHCPVEVNNCAAQSVGSADSIGDVVEELGVLNPHLPGYVHGAAVRRPRVLGLAGHEAESTKLQRRTTNALEATTKGAQPIGDGQIFEDEERVRGCVHHQVLHAREIQRQFIATGAGDAHDGFCDLGQRRRDDDRPGQSCLGLDHVHVTPGGVQIDDGLVQAARTRGLGVRDGEGLGAGDRQTGRKGEAEPQGGGVNETALMHGILRELFPCNAERRENRTRFFEFGIPGDGMPGFRAGGAARQGRVRAYRMRTSERPPQLKRSVGHDRDTR